MRFEWDDRKNESNLKKHGVTFETASLVFKDADQLPIQDREIDGEARWQTIGRAGPVLLLLVAHTVADEDEEVVRKISARKARKNERRMYEGHL